MPNNDQTTSSNTKNPHFTQTVFLRYPGTSTERLYPTSGIAPTSQRINNATAARSSHMSALDTDHIGISRVHARQAAKPTREWGIGTPTHIQLIQSNDNSLPHKPQAALLIQFGTNPNKKPCINTTRPNTGQQTYTSGQTNRRGDTSIEPDNSRKTFTYPQRPYRAVRQDKDRLKSDRAASLQPAAVNKITRSQATSRKSARIQKNLDDSRRAPIQIWAPASVKDQLVRIAASEGLSLSAAGAAYLTRGLQQHVDMQYGALINPVIEKAFAKQMSKLVTHITWLLVRIAFDCGQTRSLVTNILGRQPGITESLLKAILQGSSNTAKANIMRRTPQISDLINSVEQWMRQESRGEKDKNKSN